MRKEIIIRLIAVLLTVWFPVSIAGINRHVCIDSGDTFVSVPYAGTECSSVHPGKCCTSHSCAHCQHEARSGENSFDCGTCCINQFNTISEVPPVSLRLQNGGAEDDVHPDIPLYLHAGLPAPDTLSGVFPGVSVFMHGPSLMSYDRSGLYVLFCVFLI